MCWDCFKKCLQRKKNKPQQRERYASLTEGFYAKHMEDVDPTSEVTDTASDVTSQGDQASEFHRIVALFDYVKLFPGDLEFSKNDIMLTTSTDANGWIMAIHPKTGKTGYVPGNYVRFEDGQVENLDGFHDVDRISAEKKLFFSGEPPGTYIIRRRGDRIGFAISVLVWDAKSSMTQVHHYSIMTEREGVNYYVSRGVTFPSIKQLIEHYSVKRKGCNMELKKPCPSDLLPVVKSRDFEVDRKGIKLGISLGKGEFGEVFQATWNNQLAVAVKQCQRSADSESFLEEARTMFELNHPRIVQLLGVCTKPETEVKWIILELLPRGSLMKHLKGSDPHSITMENKVMWMTQITDGMKYLEAKNFIHRDLRACNVLMDKDYSVKVADFGLARILEDSATYLGRSHFPVRWTAPEAATGNHEFSVKSDVWSFGVVMYEILSEGRKALYEGVSNKDLMDRIINGGLRLPNPLPASDVDGKNLYEIMCKCWDLEAEKRPSFKALHKKFCTWEFANLAH